MLSNEQFISLNFNHELIGKSLLDKKSGVSVILGYASGLPPVYNDLAHYNRGRAIALENRGIGQDKLDRDCQLLAMTCRMAGMRILITKSDMPFDNRWYVIGDIKSLLALIELEDAPKLPLSEATCEEISRIL